MGKSSALLMTTDKPHSISTPSLHIITLVWVLASIYSPSLPFQIQGLSSSASIPPFLRPVFYILTPISVCAVTSSSQTCGPFFPLQLCLLGIAFISSSQNPVSLRRDHNNPRVSPRENSPETHSTHSDLNRSCSDLPRGCLPITWGGTGWVVGSPLHSSFISQVSRCSDKILQNGKERQAGLCWLLVSEVSGLYTALFFLGLG